MAALINVFDRYDNWARRVVVLAQEEARSLNHNYIGTEHILLGLIHEGEGVAAKALESLGISLQAVRQQAEEVIGLGQETPSGQPPFTPRAKRVLLELALHEARQLGHNHIGTEHILLGLIRKDDGVGVQLLVMLGADLSRLRQQVTQEIAERNHVEVHEPGTSQNDSRVWPLLDQCGSDLTEAAQRSVLDPVVGRDREVERVVEVLTRRHRNVPLLIGEPGVGKTAVTTGLAHRVAAGQVPPVLQRQTVRRVNLGALLADPQHRGRDTAVLTTLLDEVRAHGNLVVFLSGALTPLHLPDGTTNALSLCRPLLGSPGVLLVGSCTSSEYERRVLDPAVERMVQPVSIAEPTLEDAIEILKGIRDRLEEHHRVSISDAALVAAASLARDHVPDQQLPRSAIDLLDEASAQVRVREVQRLNIALSSYDAQITEVRQAKEKAIDEQDFEQAYTFREQERALLEARHEAKLSDPQSMNDLPLEIDEADVVSALSVYSGTQHPEPARVTTARRVRPVQAVEHDPFVWSMS
ncbi:Clp protease N-terminal domain-containing protein [Streptomyces microflavus]|uniref:Clp protease N-terminal domain-containing protein n=1 Tax=Streptomyces microflavus TaxID=1919 RepID=UPI0036789D5F